MPSMTGWAWKCTSVGGIKSTTIVILLEVASSLKRNHVPYRFPTCHVWCFKAPFVPPLLHGRIIWNPSAMVPRCSPFCWKVSVIEDIEATEWIRMIQILHGSVTIFFLFHDVSWFDASNFPWFNHDFFQDHPRTPSLWIPVTHMPAGQVASVNDCQKRAASSWEWGFNGDFIRF